MAVILHPTDFAEASRPAFETALAIALASGGELILVHVFRGEAAQVKNTDWSQYPHVRQTLVDWGRIEFGLPANRLRDETGLSVRKLSLPGRDPAEVMADYLENAKVDLVVMATRGAEGWAHWLSPSQAERLAGTIRQPVMFMRHGIPGPYDQIGRLTMRNVLVPVDNEPDPQLAIDALMRFRDWFAEPPEIRTIHAGPGPLDRPVVLPAGLDARLEPLWYDGAAESVIEDASRKIDADLIVMTRAGPASLAERLTGSTTTQVIARCDCPVLTVPAPDYE